MTNQAWPTPGQPFQQRFQDRRRPQQRDQDRDEVRRQVANLTKRRRDKRFRQELIKSLQDRRRDKNVVQFDALNRGEEKFETLLATGELLVRDADVGNQVVQELIQDGFDERPVACLGNRVVRLVKPQIDVQELQDRARALRAAGVEASVNHITPLGPVAKGLGGPEPSIGGDPFPPNLEASPAAETIAIVDTGIDDTRRRDGWLVDVPRTTDNIDPLDVYPPSGFLDYGAGHGTFAAGVVQQVFPQANIRMYQALDSDGIGSEVAVACAMVRAVQEGADILNLSLGVHESFEDLEPLAIRVALEIIAGTEAAERRQVLVVAAAGNYADDVRCWPAAFPLPVVAVAGLRADLQPAAWSSRGDWVDCATIAEGILSTYVVGEESREADPTEPDKFLPPDPWAVWSGTSFAAPQIAAAVARICLEEGLGRRPQDAFEELRRRGGPPASSGFGRFTAELLPGT
jgi:hypothetical protein